MTGVQTCALPIYQIENNTYGYAIYTHLFPAIMQGASAKKSIIMALQKIYEYLDNFDAVIIIRGGGATSDLNCFDDFDLAYNCAQFPLPIITGIGHERDTTVLDEISCIRVKTPTAAAEYIIERFDTAYSRLNNITAEIKNIIVNVSERENRRLALIAESIPNIVRQRIVNEKARVEYVRVRIPQLAQSFIGREQTKLEILAERMKNIIPTQIEKERTRLNNIEKIIELTSPDNVIKKGYSLTLLNGKVLRSIDDVKPGDKIETVLIDGNIKSKVY